MLPVELLVRLTVASPLGTSVVPVPIALAVAYCPTPTSTVASAWALSPSAFAIAETVKLPLLSKLSSASVPVASWMTPPLTEAEALAEARHVGGRRDRADCRVAGIGHRQADRLGPGCDLRDPAVRDIEDVCGFGRAAAEATPKKKTSPMLLITSVSWKSAVCPRLMEEGTGVVAAAAGTAHAIAAIETPVSSAICLDIFILKFPHWLLDATLKLLSPANNKPFRLCIRSAPVCTNSPNPPSR